MGKKVTKESNRVFKILKRTHKFEDLIRYKKMQAKIRRTIKTAKWEYWRSFCGSVGRKTEIYKVWGMIKKMNGIRRVFRYPTLRNNEGTAVTEQEKAEMIMKTFVKIHSSDNVSVEGRKGREKTAFRDRELIMEDEEVDDILNLPLTIRELNSALRSTGLSAPGKDQVCYIMLKNSILTHTPNQ